MSRPRRKHAPTDQAAGAVRRRGKPFNRFGGLREQLAGSYLDQVRVRVMKFPRRLIRHLETPDLPLQTLQAIRRLRRYLDELEAACILKARELGASPSDIGDALGITRQAVYNRLHNLQLRAETDPNFVIPNLSSEDVEGTAADIIDLERSAHEL